ncbi:MAG TPA: hypothetical protein VKU19_14950 [Bryobacteraceae bacterium]|nr:hypothetical protein [Bryobacteraceae bacterium]
MPKTRTAGPKARPQQAVTEPATHPTPAAAPKPQPTISPAMATIADQIADILYFGEDRALAEQVVKAAAMRRLKRFGDPEWASKVSEREAADWMEALAEDWRNNRRPEKTHPPDPVTVADRVREVIHYTLRMQFERFLEDSTGAERTLLLEIFKDRGNELPDDKDLALASSFMAQIEGESDRYVRCPSDLQKQVVAYIGCLKAAQCCKDKVA